MTVGSGLALGVLLISIGCGDGFSWSRKAAPARTYYISYTSGNDRNDGESPARAWQHLAKIFLKSTSAEPFQPGDSILLKRGDQWDEQVRLKANGNAKSPVTLGAFGRGPKPLLYGDNRQSRWEPVASHDGIYTTDMGDGSVLGCLYVDGQIVKTIFPVGSLASAEDMEMFLARLQPGTPGGQFGGRLWIRMMDNREPIGTVRIFRSAGVSLSDSSYVQIENLDIERFHTGIDITNSRRVTVRHNDIQDVLGIGIYLRSQDAHCRVESNTVFRGGNTALYVLKGSSNTFRDNWVSHVDGTVLGIRVNGDGMGVGLQESQRTLVEYNYLAYSGGVDFYHEQDSIVRYNYLYRVRSAGSPNGLGLSVYGNIYNLGGPAGKRGSTGVNIGVMGPGTIAVFNNTVLNAYAYSLMGSSAKGSPIVFSDNIVSSTFPGAMATFGDNVVSNHNCFFTSGTPVFSFSKTNFPSLETYQAESHLDRESIFADPQFFSKTPVTPFDFRVKPGSKCNSPASSVDLRDPSNGRTYDHSRRGGGAPIMGAWGAYKTARHTDYLAQPCKSYCVGHAFRVPSGVYLVRLKLAAGVLSQKQAGFVLNGKRVVVEFDSSALGGANDSSQDFLVRTDCAPILLEPSVLTDTSAISEIEIQAFDASHGNGPQVIPW